MDKQQELDKLNEQIKKCTACPLFKNANLAVPGEGDSKTKVMFIGEGPGYWEDQKGRPFVGQAGKLLDELLKSIGFERSQVFIGNVIKHRPLDNRDPLPEEIEACRPFLDQQITIIDPKVIVTLGRFSLNKFLPGEYISHVHGEARFVDFAGKQRIVLPMYHPAAALRRGSIKEQLAADFKKILEFINNDNLVKKEDSPDEDQEKNKEKQIDLFN